ncbi:GNAT family N-acetyltransferase [Mycolicibacterium sp. 018/SC-01/001]|uniref:MSMEG_0567/sll0787 family protein n=1 Tax=Mycolicibacterium sp. 018/SC-01/001 TaxID=2592069 RepID=UPI00117C9D7D|nr:MSMEG_0567/sll0787 family protein [Mycolicibacterium sp. 018/SC-01/001]TRW80340.1 GNAT family N-acetyltransferase [Mycolicibacterium sp. 018/SC-01/001]
MIPFAASAHAPVGLSILSGTPRPPAPFLITPASTSSALTAYRRLRRDEFVSAQGLFTGSDRDDIDDDPRTVVLVATAPDGHVLGGVRLAPATDPDIGWWTGSRLVVHPGVRSDGVGPALVRAACAHAESAGVLRFEATVQRRYSRLFEALGWDLVGERMVAGQEHAWMRWPIASIQRLATATKAFLGDALAPLRSVPGALGPAGYVGDDGVPVPGSDLIAACDAIIPSMVERDPEWAGWCSVLVNVNDLAAMGARPIGLLDAVGAPNRALLDRVISGVARASAAWQVPVLGGHTQLGVPAALSVTALGRSSAPVRAGGAAVGDTVRLTADLSGQWRPGYQGRQWDSTSRRSSADLVAMTGLVAQSMPASAKDVSMAGIGGTLGMMAEACGTGAEIDVASVPRPVDAAMGDWLTCFPGFGMLTAGPESAQALPAGVDSAECGVLTTEPGVRLRWPDGVVTGALAPAVTGLGPS